MAGWWWTLDVVMALYDQHFMVIDRGRVIGIESNATQRGLATRAGLEVVSTWEEIDCVVDIIVACYALHMGCSGELFSLARRSLRPGGIMLANCYKDVGMEHIDPTEYRQSLQIVLVPRFVVGRGPLLVARRHAESQ